MNLKVEHQNGTFYWFIYSDDQFFAYRYVLNFFEALKLPAPTGFKVMKSEGHGPLSLTVMPPYERQDGKWVDLSDAPMEEWNVLASEEAQLRLGVPKHMVDAQKVLSEALLAREWPGGQDTPTGVSRS
ncbi:hypothetical protein LCGC14_2584020 [marine sediment metagenome]|uniref:Uncharacterized protein n=1 Tax=marine sediment metagenome TaxID=412755 RepID=A0A0F9D6C0_9ZZZZ